jgi:hypothetical protein
MTEIARIGFDKRAKELATNYAGILENEGTSVERLSRVAGLVPVFLEVVEEARDTVARLREENEEVKRQALVTGANWEKKILDVREATLTDLWRQYRAVSSRLDWAEFLFEVTNVFGISMSRQFQEYASVARAKAEAAHKVEPGGNDGR